MSSKYLILAMLCLGGSLVVALVSYRLYPMEQKIIRLTLVKSLIAGIVIGILALSGEPPFEKFILILAFVLVFGIVFLSIFTIVEWGVRGTVVSEIMLALAWGFILLHLAI